MSNAGHDVGGFAGPAPSAELLARWVAACALLPRLSIHSWKAGEPTAPWSHPAAAPAIGALLRLRGTLQPHLYTLLHAHAAHGAPVCVPPWAAFPRDPACLAEGEARGGRGGEGGAEDGDEDGEGCAGDSDEFMLGDALLVAPVLWPGALERAIPRTPDAGAGGWLDFWSGTPVPSAASVTLPAPWGRLPMLARAGAALPVDPRRDGCPRPPEGACPHAWLVFPAPAASLGGGGVSAISGRAYLDDGVTAAWDTDSAVRELAGEGDAALLALRVTTRPAAGWRGGGDAPPGAPVCVWLPAGDARAVTLHIDGRPASLLADAVVLVEQEEERPADEGAGAAADGHGSSCRRRQLLFAVHAETATALTTRPCGASDCI